MADIERIRELWSTIEDQPFPKGYAGVEIEGICLAELDTFASGCISTFLSDGKLSKPHEEILEKCCVAMKKVVPKLEGEARSFFATYSSVADSVLELIQNRVR